MLRLEIKSEVITSRNGVKAGRAWETNTQEAWVLLKNNRGETNPYPEKVVLMLDKGTDGVLRAYEKGIYTFDVEASIYIGDFNGLRLGRPVLQKFNESVKQAA